MRARTYTEATLEIIVTSRQWPGLPDGPASRWHVVGTKAMAEGNKDSMSLASELGMGRDEKAVVRNL